MPSKLKRLTSIPCHQKHIRMIRVLLQLKILLPVKPEQPRRYPGRNALSLFATVQTGDITKTIIFATVGAVVSFLVSLGLKWIAKKLRTR